MKKLSIAILVFSFYFEEVHAQTLFNYSIDNDSAINISDIMVVDNDKKFFITSNYLSPDSSLMIKYDLDGNIVWQQKVVRDIFEGFHRHAMGLQSMVQLDTTYLLLGYMNKPFRKLVVMHFSRSGNLLDYKVYSINEARLPYLITLSDDMHITITTKWWNGAQDQLMWLRINLDGSAWGSSISNFNRDIYPVKMIPMNNYNGEVLVAAYAGDAYPPNPPEENFPRIFKIDSSGNYIWVKDFDLSYNVTLTDFIRTSDQGFVMIGNGQRKSYVFKTDSDFVVQWMKSVEFPDTTATGPFPGFFSVCEKENHHLLIGGSQRFQWDNYFSLLIETDSVGTLLQARLDSNGNVISKMSALPNGFTLLTGRDQYNHLNLSTLNLLSEYACELTPAILTWYNDEFPAIKIKEEPAVSIGVLQYGNYNFHRLDQNNIIYNGCSDYTSVPDPIFITPEISLYPNPFSVSSDISFSLKENSDVSITLFDLAGRKIKTLLNENVEAGNHNLQLDREQMSAGIYFLQLKSNGNISTIKIVVQ